MKERFGNRRRVAVQEGEIVTAVFCQHRIIRTRLEARWGSFGVTLGEGA